eukprot:822918-Prymnesium_polylepis.1
MGQATELTPLHLKRRVLSKGKVKQARASKRKSGQGAFTVQGRNIRRTDADANRVPKEGQLWHHASSVLQKFTESAFTVQGHIIGRTGVDANGTREEG